MSTAAALSVQRSFVGMAQWLGRRPITEPVLPRLALSNWTESLEGAPPVRRRVVVTAFRNRTWVEWAVYAACQLRRRGVATTLVHSSSDLRKLYPLERLAGLSRLTFWGGVGRIPDVRLVDLDAWLPSAQEAGAYAAFADEFAPTVAAYDLHVEENEDGARASAYRRAVKRSRALLAETGAAFERILAENPVARVVCYSGLIDRSPALCEAARRAAIEVLTVEGWSWRPGHMICNLNGPALEYNVEEWLRALGEWDVAKDRETDQLLRFQEGTLEDEESGPEKLQGAQRSSMSAPLPARVDTFLQRPGPRFLLATNVVGDSSMLRRQPIFRNQRDWLKRTIDHVRAHADWNLVIRAHPEEARLVGKVVVNMGAVARDLAADAPNVLVIDAADDVSSYALMPGLSGGLVWISSIGADMVARGIPVLAAARPKYHALGLVEEPPSVGEYLKAVSGLADRSRSPSADQRQRARRYLNLVFSSFSFDAFSPSYRARDLFLDGPGSPPDADTFYRIVAGDLPPETPAQAAAGSVGKTC